MMTNIPRVLREENLCWNGKIGSSGKRAMGRPELKSVSWKEEVVRKFTKREDSVTVSCAGTCPTAKTCLLSNQYRKFVGCYLNSEVLSDVKTDFLLTSPSQVLDANSNSTGNKELGAVASRLKKTFSAVLTRRRATVWEVPRRLSATQVMPKHIWHFFCTL